MAATTDAWREERVLAQGQSWHRSHEHGVPYNDEDDARTMQYILVPIASLREASLLICVAL